MFDEKRVISGLHPGHQMTNFGTNLDSKRLILFFHGYSKLITLFSLCILQRDMKH